MPRKIKYETDFHHGETHGVLANTSSRSFNIIMDKANRQFASEYPIDLDIFYALDIHLRVGGTADATQDDAAGR